LQKQSTNSVAFTEVVTSKAFW